MSERLSMRRRTTTLPTRFAGSVIAGGLLALLLTVGAGFLAVQEVQTSQAAERMRVVAHRIGTTLEQRVDLGLALSMLDDTQREIEREKVASAGIARIDVFGERGIRLFSTDRLAVGEPVPADWLTALDGLRDSPWRVRGDDGVSVGVPVVNSFNRPVGGVVVVVAPASLGGGGGFERLWQLFWPGLGLLLLCGLLAQGAGVTMLGASERALARSAGRLTAVLERRSVNWDDGAGAPAVDATVRRLTGLLDAAEAAEAEIHHLDQTT